ncbi:hypothetical protein BDZ89DRAFT_1036153 [Hymenopellis radicata]|nr:hypothetical protein BDZ89DRAFT_1036153 [Hymenopellis radicata]
MLLLDRSTAIVVTAVLSLRQDRRDGNDMKSFPSPNDLKSIRQPDRFEIASGWRCWAGSASELRVGGSERHGGGGGESDSITRDQLLIPSDRAATAEMLNDDLKFKTTSNFLNLRSSLSVSAYGSRTDQ